MSTYLLIKCDDAGKPLGMVRFDGGIVTESEWRNFPDAENVVVQVAFHKATC